LLIEDEQDHDGVRGDERCCARKFKRFYAPGVTEEEIQAAAERLFSLAA